MLDLVGNPEDRFSHKEAHLSRMVKCRRIIRIYHEFVDKSVPRVTAWHQEAQPSDAKQ